MAAPATCDAEQTADHVVLQYPIHRPSLGLHGPTFLDGETIDLLLNTCPEIECGQAVPERSGANDEKASASLFLRSVDIPNLNLPRCTVFNVLNKLIIKLKIFHPQLFLPESSLE